MLPGHATAVNDLKHLVEEAKRFTQYEHAAC